MTSPSLDVDLLRARDPRMTLLFLDVVRRRARRFFRTPAEVESAAAEALAELLGKLERGDDPDRAKVWALTAASNAARRILNRERMSIEYQSGVHTAAQQSTLSEIARCRELLQRIQRMLLTMPELTQKAVIATAVDGRTVESFALEAGVAPGTVRKQLVRVRRKFTHELSGPAMFERLCELAKQARQTRLGAHERPPIHDLRASVRESSSVASR